MTKFLQRLLSDVPMIEYGALMALVNADPASVELAEHPVIKRMRDGMKPQVSFPEKGLAMVPVEGALAHNPDVMEMLFGVEDSRNVLQMIDSVARDERVERVLLNIDSPGGMQLGGFEIADAVNALSNHKPVIAYSSGWMTSLAYLIGSQANEVITSRTAQVGSIGAIISFPDISKMLEARGIKWEQFTNKEGTLKGTASGVIPLTDEQRTFLQARADKSFTEMKRQITAKRPNIPAEAMKGQSIDGADGKRFGLVDRIGSLEFAISMLKGTQTQ